MSNKRKNTSRRANFVLTDEILEEIRVLSNRGLNQTHIYGYYGMSESAWKRLLVKDPRVREYYNKGKSKGISFAAGKLMDLIKIGNLEAIKFYLARVGKFTEQPDNEYINEENKPKTATITFNVTDPLEAAKVYAQIMQRSIQDD